MTTKCCNKCKLIKSFSEFNQNKSRKDGYHSICRECMKTYLQNHYSNNKEYYRNKARKVETTTKHILMSIKENTPCQDCNHYYDPVCMDFDHIRQKSFNISQGVGIYGYSLITILKEIENCEIVCSNCHRLRTKNRIMDGK